MAKSTKGRPIQVGSKKTRRVVIREMQRLVLNEPATTLY
jgi:hypothetical protein